MQAYVFIRTEPGWTRNTLRYLTAEYGVKTADVVTGDYDIIALVEASDMERLSRILTVEIPSRPGVMKTTTSVILPTAA